jgi:hypothetical protein
LVKVIYNNLKLTFAQLHEIVKKYASSLFLISTSYENVRNRKFERDYIALALMADRFVQLGSSDCPGFLCHQGHVTDVKSIDETLQPLRHPVESQV